jgi:hypothetical protein
MMRLLLNAPLIPAATFVAALLGCGYAAVQTILMGIASRWPTVEGDVVQAYLTQTGYDARGLQERVVYRYHVGGKAFLNDRVRFGPRARQASIVPAAGHPPGTTAVHEEFPPGRRVLVRYNPRQPQESVLYAQPNFAAVVVFIATAVCLFVGVRGVFLHR